MLQIEDHSQEEGPDDIDDERPQGKRRNATIQTQRDEETEEAAQWREKQCEEHIPTPRFLPPARPANGS